MGGESKRIVARARARARLERLRVAFFTLCLPYALFFVHMLNFHFFKLEYT